MCFTRPRYQGERLQDHWSSGLTFLTKIPASNKGPLEIKGGKPILPTAVCFLIYCSIAKKYKLLFHKLS